MKKQSYCLTLFVLVLYCNNHAIGQELLPSDSSSSVNYLLNMNPRVYRSHDTVWIYSGICKTLKTVMLTGSEAVAYLPEKPIPVRRPSFLRMHGTIQYDFTYRSFVDTPFSQTDFTQHSIRATIDFTVRDKYPFRLTMQGRQSNSPYFNNIADVNVQFDRRMFFNRMKENLRKNVMDVIAADKRLGSIENLYNEKKREADNLQGWLQHPARVQEVIEEKEKSVRNSINTMPKAAEDRVKQQVSSAIEKKLAQEKDSISSKADSLLARHGTGKDSLTDAAQEKIRRKQDELKKLVSEMTLLKQKGDDIKKALRDSVDGFNRQLNAIRDPSALKRFIEEQKPDSNDLPEGWKAISAINTVSIGRSWIDYSDLTVKNISLTGINAEITPSRYYLAFAAGKVNYRFRDFVLKNNDLPSQSLVLARAGIGDREKSSFILTWYSGKRSMIYSFNSAMDGRLEKVIGMSAETRLQLNSNNYVVLEVAKSSFHNTSVASQSRGERIKKLWNFKDRSNEAYSIKLNSTWPQVATSITGYYRKMGAHFQSFNLQPVNVDHEAYQLKVQQHFFKRKLTVNAGIQKNDFNNPFINPGMTSKTVFKSVQVSLRVPKYPFVSVGYYPSSQLTVLDNDVIVENRYNTLSAVASYAYRVRNTAMSSNLVYLRFYNSGADTGFIYYNASSWTINQYIFLKRLQLQTGLMLTRQRELNVMTLEQSVSWQLRHWLSASGGLKYNRVKGAGILWGGTAGVGVIIKKFGTIQASYDKSFLPGLHRNLLPVDMGKVGYTRTF